MPTNGISSDWLADLDDDMAQIITAQEQLNKLRHLIDYLVRRNQLRPAYGRDCQDAIDHIAGALLTGKQNTAKLRRCA